MCRNELWIDKYKPHSLEELAVHKKKVIIVFFFFHYKRYIDAFYYVMAGR